ncbi:MAG: DUF4830 domain-containing protein [Oscillospiraceae bacterium]|nr:DUF4830 domain-containing protein [Oscillospiraceae bacterium]
MVSFRLRGKRIIGILAACLVLVLGVVGVRALTGSDAIAAEAAAKPPSVKAKTNEERLAFINAYGWEVEEEPLEVTEVIIPKEFDSVYEEYNSIQKKLGFDLSKHAGKRARRYTYIVTNYPGQNEDIRLNLLVRSNKIIGGDVCSLLENGFLHGFNMPAEVQTDTGAGI